MDAVAKEGFDFVLKEVQLLREHLGEYKLDGHLAGGSVPVWSGFTLFTEIPTPVVVTIDEWPAITTLRPKFRCGGTTCYTAGDAASVLLYGGRGLYVAPQAPQQVFQKHDQDKPRTDLLPPKGTLAVARVLGFGAKKYGADNWHKAAPDEALRRYAGAMLRHTLAILAGEACDPETGESHAAHAACCALFLAEFHERQELDKPTTKA